MAQTKAMSYDHPAYTAVLGAALGTVGAGSGAASQRFCAPTALTIKSINYSTVTQGTGAATDAKSLLILRQGTATTTQILGTTTAASYVLNVVGTVAALAAGDVAWVAKGTDGTEVGAASLEYVVTPGASVTP